LLVDWVCGQPSTQVDDGGFVGRNFGVSVVPTASLLLLEQEQTKDVFRALMLLLLSL
jgi:hypothetical protein